MFWALKETILRVFLFCFWKTIKSPESLGSGRTVFFLASKLLYCSENILFPMFNDKASWWASFPLTHQLPFVDYHYCRYTGTWNRVGGDYLQGQMPTAAGFFLILWLSNSCGLVVPLFTCTNVLLQGSTLKFQGRSITEPVHCGKSRQPQPCKISDFLLQGLIWSYQEGLIFLCCWRAWLWGQELSLLC